MNFKGKYILAAIDGTCSRTWISKGENGRPEGLNSHTYQFYKDFVSNCGRKEYWHGPGGLDIYKIGIDWGKYAGAGSGQIITKVVGFIQKAIFDLTGKKLNKKFLSLSDKEKKALRSEMEDKVRICLVGHSRGAYICILAAQKLSLPVYFMGLYDAVDIHYTNSGFNPNKILNVDFPYHAMRDPKVNSRSYFYNAGEIMPEKNKKIFYTTHGGVGGYPDAAIAGELDTLSKCNTISLQANIELFLGFSRKEKCELGSIQANDWIREKARGLGIKF